MDETFLLRCKEPLTCPRPDGKLYVKHVVLDAKDENNPVIKKRPIQSSLFIQSFFSSGHHTEVWDKLMTIKFVNYTADQIDGILRCHIEYNGVIYCFLGFSNTQLKEKTCFLVKKDDKKINDLLATPEFHVTVERMFEPFEKSMQVKKDEIEFAFNSRDGKSGFMKPELAERVRTECGLPETPGVVQVICKGFAGVLVKRSELVQRSEITSSEASNLTMGIVECFQSYTVGYLDIVSMMFLEEKGILREYLSKLQEHFLRVLQNIDDLTYAKYFLRQIGRTDLIAKIENGIPDHESNDEELCRIRNEEIRQIQGRNKDGGTVSAHNFRVFVPQSREVFGVIDPYPNGDKKLKENECVFFPSLPLEREEKFELAEEVLVIPQPCCKSEEIRKLSLVRNNDQYRYLKECIVLPSHTGARVAGKKYFVCWDRNLIPAEISSLTNFAKNLAKLPQCVPNAVCKMLCLHAEKPCQNSSKNGLQGYFANYKSNDELVARAKSLFMENASEYGPSCYQCRRLSELLSPDYDWNGERDRAEKDLKKLEEKNEEAKKESANESKNVDEASFSPPQQNFWKAMEERFRTFVNNFLPADGKRTPK